MNVVIVDDNLNDAEKVKSIVEEYMETKKIDGTLDVFTDPKALLEKIEEQKPYDLFLLDIFMEKLDGFSLCHRIREKYIHPICIFVSYSSEGAIEGIESFLDAWNMVEQPIAYLKEFDNYPLSVALAYVAPDNLSRQLVSCILAALPPLLLFAFFKEELVKGIVFAEEK